MTSSGSPANGAESVSPIALERVCDRQSQKLDAEILREAPRVLAAPLRRIRPGHADAENVFASERVGGDCRHEGGIDAAAQADDSFAEPALANVIARAEHERPVGGFEFILRLAANIADARRAVEEHQVLFEGLRQRGDAPVRHERDARAVKYEAVVAAHLIHVGDGNLLLHGDSAQHVAAQFPFVQRVGRRRKIQNDVASLRHEFRHRIAVVQPLRPEILVVPGVLADGYAEFRQIQRENVLRVGGLEVARLVEHIVGGEQHFSLFEEYAAVRDKCGAVRHRFAGVVLRPAYVADERWQRNRFRQTCECLQVAFDERRALHQILRRIAAETKLREQSEFRTAGLCFAGQFQNPRRIAFEIADCRIELREGNLHWNYLAYGARAAFSMPGNSRISKKRHESEVHVSLVVAMEQSRAGIVRCEVHVGSRVCRNHQHILLEPGDRRSIQASDLERMPVQMKRMIVRAAIDHPQPYLRPCWSMIVSVWG